VRLVVTGASGKLGRRVAELVAQRVTPHGLILVTRNPGALAPFATRGVSVRYGDFADPPSLRAAFAGGDRLLLISTTNLAKRSAEHAAAVAAARAAGVGHVIYTSGLEPGPPNPAVVAPSHHATEQALAQSGMRWTVLRNSLYSDYQRPEAERAIADGSFVHNRGTGTVAYVAREDCAAVAAAVLTQGGHAGSIYDVTGPESYGAPELASLYGELGRCAVTPIERDDDAFTAGVASALGNDDHARYGAELVASFGRAIREGYMRSRTDVVERLTGSPARTLREVLASVAGAA
jgi:NAD(P)H dehydrogenase (quinone)